MQLFYDFGIRLYYAGIKVASLRNAKAQQWLTGRRNWRNNYAEKLQGLQKPVWIHCASLGEFEQGRPIIEQIKKSYPDKAIVLSFFSPSGYEVRKEYELADAVVYLPLDTAANAQDFVALCDPCMAIFVKYEFWLHYFESLSNASIPTYIVSAIFRPGQRFFGSNGKWWRRILQSTSHIFVQDRESEKLLTDHGIKRVSVTGDTRFDRVSSIAQRTKNLPIIEAFAQGKKTIIMGSSWVQEERMMAELFQKHEGSFRIIIAPHEIHEEHLKQIERLFPGALRYSQANMQSVTESPVLLVDNVGLLSSIYSLSDLAIVGGGFGAGIHNILEPAAFGIPIVFGPNNEKFKEARDLMKLGGAFQYTNAGELESLLKAHLLEAEKGSGAGRICAEYVSENKGATQIVMNHLAKMLEG